MMVRWFHRRDNRVTKHPRRILRAETLERREVLSGNGLVDAAAIGPALAGDGVGNAVQAAPQAYSQVRVALMPQAPVMSQQQQQSNQGGAGQGGGGQVGNTLDSQEIADLLHMREEEKLARDVYLKMGEQYGVPIFDNIAQSEQRHMDAVKGLLDKYGLEDPVGDNPVGVFEDTDLQTLYDALIARGETSLAEAYQVGVDIELLDISDLEIAIAATDNADIQRVYSNLLAGSQNHLAAFTAELDSVAVALASSSAVVAADSAAVIEAGQNTDPVCEQPLQTRTQLQQSDQCDQSQQRDRVRDQVFDGIGDKIRLRLRDLTCVEL